MAIIQFTPKVGLYEEYQKEWLDCNNPEFDTKTIAEKVKSCDDKYLQIFLKNTVWQTDENGASDEEKLAVLKGFLETFKRSEVFQDALIKKYFDNQKNKLH
jgi:hypothetical protein